LKVKLKGRERNLVIFLTAVMLFFSYYSFLIRPRLSKIQELDREILQIKTELQQGQKAKEAVIFKKQEFSIKKENLEHLKDAVSENLGIPEIIADIEQTMNNCRIVEDYLIPGTVNNDESKACYSIPIRLGFTGEYRDMTSFLEALEGKRRLINIKEVHIKRDEQVFTPSKPLKGEVVMLIYAYTDRENPSNMPEPFLKGSFGKEAPFR
jgi:Tfp pilus assembly protein PilO